MSGPLDAVSFNDESSPDTRSTKKRNVSIVGQVRRERPIDWYFDLVALWGNPDEEPKSRKIIEAYNNLPKSRQEKVWETLKEIQINITDPLPFQAWFEQSIQRVMNRSDAVDVLRQQANTKASSANAAAKEILSKFHDFTAESILRSSPAEHLSFLLDYRRGMGGYGYARYISDADIGYRRPRREYDLSRFRSENEGSIIRNVVTMTAKSASVFSDAIEAVTSGHISYVDDFNIYRAIQSSHAFDKGNKKIIDLIEEEREEIAKQVSYHTFLSGMHPLSPLHGNVESKESFYIQAADIAAGFASHLYEQDGILAVALRFEYVVFNGKRISADEADQTMREWKQKGYL